MESILSQCHGYRNSTDLDEGHLAAAKRMLGLFRFVGFQEAYNSSVLLLGATFGLELDGSDFEKARHTEDDELYRCKGYRRRNVGNDATVCRAVMRANWADCALYEAAHRDFCARLLKHGLMRNPMVIEELGRSGLCGELDFSDPDQFCAKFETPEVLEFRKADKARCISQVRSMEVFRGQF